MRFSARRLTVAALALAAFARVALAAAPTARDLIAETSNQVIAVLKDKSLSSPDKVKKIENIAYAHFDFDTMSKLVLARNWAKLTPEQQKQFVAEFRQHLSVTYGKNVDNYKNETIDILGDREEARGDWTVKTRIDRGGGSNDISVDYRLRNSGDRWQIIDVTIEGVSLIANFRSQFQDILSHDSADKMLALLREKNASGESILPKENARTGG